MDPSFRLYKNGDSHQNQENEHKVPRISSFDSLKPNAFYSNYKKSTSFARLNYASKGSLFSLYDDKVFQSSLSSRHSNARLLSGGGSSNRFPKLLKSQTLLIPDFRSERDLGIGRGAFKSFSQHKNRSVSSEFSLDIERARKPSDDDDSFSSSKNHVSAFSSLEETTTKDSSLEPPPPKEPKKFATTDFEWDLFTVQGSKTGKKASMGFAAKERAAANAKKDTATPAPKKPEAAQDVSENSPKPRDLEKEVSPLVKKYEQKLHEVIYTRDGSYEIQDDIRAEAEDSSTQFLDFVVESLRGHFFKVMTTSYSNYVFKLLVDKCSNEQLADINTEVIENVVEISNHMLGTRSIQYLIEKQREEKEKERLLRAVAQHVRELSFNPYGNHVIQTVLREFRGTDQLSILLGSLSATRLDLCKDKFGCCVVQREIEVSNDKDAILKNLIDNFDVLVNDPYGYFVIQYLIQNEIGIRHIFRKVREKGIIRAGDNKYSSNVIEKLVYQLRGDDRRTAVRDVIALFKKKKPSERPLFLYQLLEHQFSNYIMQAIMRISSDEEFRFFGDLAMKKIDDIYYLKCGLKITGMLKERGYAIDEKYLKPLKNITGGGGKNNRGRTRWRKRNNGRYNKNRR